MQYIQAMHQTYSVSRLLFCTFLSTLLHFKHSLTTNIQTNLYLPSKSDVFHHVETSEYIELILILNTLLNIDDSLP